MTGKASHTTIVVDPNTLIPVLGEIRAQLEEAFRVNQNPRHARELGDPPMQMLGNLIASLRVAALYQGVEV